MKTLAIVGLGMALSPHMASLPDLRDRVRLSHAVTRSPARGAEFQARYGITPIHDLDGVLADPAVDMVLLLTPPESHRDLGERVLSAGKHLLIEKPAGLVTADTRVLAERADAAGLLAAPVLQHRFRPAIRAVQAMIAAGELGRLCGAHCLIPWWRPQSYYDAPGRGTYARDGGGVLLTQAVHTLDVLRALCGSITITSARAVTTPIHRMEAEDLVCALADFGPDGAPGTIMATTSCYPGMTETMTLIFERATIRIDGLQAQVFHADGRSEEWGAKGASGNTADPMAFDHADHRNLITAFLDAAEGRAPLAVDLFDLIATRELIDRMT